MAQLGLGLIAGAILVRGVMDRREAEGPSSRLANLSLGVLGAAGYTGLLVWHGGLGGSAPLKVAEAGHLASLVPKADWVSELPEALTLGQTALTGWSQTVTWTVVGAVVLTFMWLGRRITGNPDEVLPPVAAKDERPVQDVPHQAEGLAEQLDRGRLVPVLLGVACVAGAVSWAWNMGPLSDLAFVTPDWINMVLLGAALLAHGQVKGLLRALDEAIAGASGILLQFPLYFGIMGMVSGTGVGHMVGRISRGRDVRELVARSVVFVFRGPECVCAQWRWPMGSARSTRARGVPRPRRSIGTGHHGDGIWGRIDQHASAVLGIAPSRHHGLVCP